MDQAVNIPDIQHEIQDKQAQAEKLRKEAEELEKQLKRLQEEAPEYQVARVLHSKFCVHNHTDGCGWFYEMKDKQDNWSGRAHNEYLTKARHFMVVCNKHHVTPEAALELVAAARGR